MGVLDGLGKITGTASNLASGAVGVGSGLLYGATGGRVGSDLTPGYSATNVIKTQAGNLLGGNGSSSPQGSTGSQTNGNVLDSTTTTPGGVYTGTNGGAGGGSSADIAAYQDNINALNQLLANADITRNNGTNSINTGFENSLAQLQGNQTNTLNQYGTQRTNTEGEYAKAIQQINSNARNGYNSLQRLLGGTGSAGDILAPFAVSQQANSQRGASSDAYAKNQQAIQQGIDAANLNFNNQKKSLEGQKNSQLSSLPSSIDQQKIQYQQQLASANNQLNAAKGGSYQTPVAQNNAIAALLAEQNGLNSQYAQPTFSVQDYVAPQTDLATYQADAARLAGGNNDPSTTPEDDTASALQALLKQQRTNTYSY